MFYLALCDDCKNDLQEIMECLGALKKENYRMEIMPYLTGPELIREYEIGRRFNLLVLDMYMEPINGIETAKQIRKIDTTVPILIVTSTIEFALEGYSVNAYRYLLKPIDKKVFLNEVRTILNKQEKADQHYFSISNEQGISKVKLEDILYFESDLKTIYLQSWQQRYAFRGTISEVAEKLEKFNFVRVHKSYVVSLRYVKNIFKGVITMENGVKIYVSKYHSKKVYELLMQYIEAGYGS